MAKIKQLAVELWTTSSKYKKTSQGNSRRVSLCMMNKHKRKSFKAYRGQGR
jgi:hypothetical protein